MSKGQIDKLKVDRPPPLKDEPTSRRALWFLRHARVWTPAGAWPIVRSGLFNPTPLAEASMTSRSWPSTGKFRCGSRVSSCLDGRALVLKYRSTYVLTYRQKGRDKEERETNGTD